MTSNSPLSKHATGGKQQLAVGVPAVPLKTKPWSTIFIEDLDINWELRQYALAGPLPPGALAVALALPQLRQFFQPPRCG